MTTPEPLIEFHGVSRRFGMQEVRDVSPVINRGESVAVIGESGWERASPSS